MGLRLLLLYIGKSKPLPVYDISVLHYQGGYSGQLASSSVSLDRPTFSEVELNVVCPHEASRISNAANGINNL